MVGSGFTNLVFTLTADGQTVVSKTFTTLAKAVHFFTDHAKDLGSTLTLTATFKLTTDAANSGFYAQIILGDPPPAAHGAASRFAQAAAGLGGEGAGAINGGASGRWTDPPMLAAGRLIQAV